MPRFLAPAAALGLAATLCIAAPANANIYTQKCRTIDGITILTTTYHGRVCVWAQYHNDAGPHGLTVTQVGAFIDTNITDSVEWENGNPRAIDGASLVVKNDKSPPVVKWLSVGDQDDQTNDHDPVMFTPSGGVDMPDADSALIQYTGAWHWNGEPDPDNPLTVGLTIHD